ncbi:hypothetical protein [Streptomyces himalayensis]|uniref:Lipoprotein n=1 Tax=Streptomyces himalayensis subsp. himalayensis TaxID=2756131 RepID=A0A7W0IA78_9ACTN|nr:hypothetical protein [Streptomyces himalayensis]MBA2948107.1 hypothetical protein [Streptomyces himalayensis subsp. himalayensis]
MKSTAARCLALSIAVSAVLATAGCRSPGDSGVEDKASRRQGGGVQVSPMAELRTVARTTERADSAKVESTTIMGTTLSMTADGALAWAGGLKGTLTITYTGGQLADTMRQLGSTSMEARYLHDAYYARMSDEFAARASGKHWIKYEYEALADFAGGSGAYLEDQMQNTTPNQSVKLLLASGDVRKVGEERVRGVATTHYSGTVDVTDLEGRNANLGDDHLADVKRQLEQAGITTEKVDIWVDGRNLLVKKTEKAEMAIGAMSSTAYYSDYGTPVSALKPPAADTADFRDLVHQQSAG